MSNSSSFSNKGIMRVGAEKRTGNVLIHKTDDLHARTITSNRKFPLFVTKGE